jgi:hypothetical protein
MQRVLIVLVAALLAAPAPARADSLVARFVGERYDYDVSFLVFGRAAIGRITLEPERDRSADGRGFEGSGRYVARLLAETKGFVGWLKPRRHLYTSVIVPCEERQRFCTRIFEKDMREGDHREVTTTFVSHERRLMTWIVRRGGRPAEVGREDMPAGVRYDDMLAAFFNFRAGVYGPIEKGRRYEIDMLPVEGVRTFELRVLAAEEDAETRRRLGLTDDGLVLAVRLPKALFKSEGEIFVWFSDEMAPLGATVKNYLGLGDVTGTLRAARVAAGAPPADLGIVERARDARREPPATFHTPDR